MKAFTWHDGERTIRFGRGAVGDAVDVLGGPGYALLTTPRARAAAPAVVEAAASVHDVAPGHVDALAGDLLGTVSGDRIVALGGGRVIDVAKALAAASGGAARAMAIPTTLSGAEMTRIHRQAAGAAAGQGVRPAVVVNDPALSASQPERELAASALNALAHAAEGPCTTRTNPVATLAALEAARLLAGAWGKADREGVSGTARREGAGTSRRDAAPGTARRDAAASPGEASRRDALALGALLAGYAIDSTLYGLHHVLAQTLVRLADVGHGAANAIMLPHTLGALAWRFPDWDARLGEALGGEPAEVAARLCARTGAATLGVLGVDGAALDACADAAAERPELALTPPRADRAELRALYDHAH